MTLASLCLDPPAAAPTTAGALTLADGRRLGYADYGAPRGRPVLLFHGLPGSRLQGHPDRTIPAALGLRIIAPERPGYGLSDPLPGRAMGDWPADVAALADHLGLDRFAVLGVSGGGPYAAACARALADRLDGVSLVSPLGPLQDPALLAGMSRLDRTLLALARRGAWAVYPPGLLLATLARRLPTWYLGIMDAHLPAPDRRICARPAVRRLIREDLAAAFCQGAAGALQDIVLLARPWGFPLEAIDLPVRLWHGLEDGTVPPAVGRALAAALPRCQARFVAGAGHLLVIERWREILADLARAAWFATRRGS